MASPYSQSQIGPYLLEQEIGRGGMGLVYRAIHQGTKEVVAIKTLLRPGHEVHTKSLLDEAITGNKLDHPNCLKSYGVLTYGPAQSPAIVSEYIEGLNLRDFLDSIRSAEKGFQFSPLCATLILEQLFLGLRAAHKAGLIHQDVKPDNYLIPQWAIDRLKVAIQAGSEELRELLFELRDSGWLKLSDWGLSILKERERANNSQSLSLSLSQIPEGKRGGTIVYMPMEQIDGVGISRRTDIFALSLIYYELLTGHPPRNARSTAEGLDPQCFEDLQAYLIQMISSSAQSAIDPKKDPTLKHLKKYPRIQELLLSMSMRQKTERLGSAELEDELEETIDLLEDAEDESTNWPLYLSFLTFLLPLALWYIFTQGVGLKTNINKNESPKNVLTQAPKETQQSPAKSSSRIENSEKKDVEYTEEDLDKLRQGDLFTAQKLKHIDQTLGRILGAWPQPILLLDGAESISEEGAKGLAKYSGGLLLRNLKTVSFEAMTELAQSSCFAMTLGLKESVENSIFVALAKYKGQSLSIGYSARLTKKNAQALANYSGQSLTLLAPIQPGLMTTGALVRSKAKNLTLQGIQNLDAITAITLSQFSGNTLTFSQLSTLNLRSALALGRAKVKRLVFSKLKTLMPEAALELSKFKGEQLTLGLPTLSPESATALSKFKGKNLVFSRLKELTTPQATVIRDSRCEQLSFEKLGRMNPLAVKALAQFRGNKLTFKGFYRFDTRHSEALSQFTGREIELNSKQAIDNLALQKMSPYPGKLSLSKAQKAKFNAARNRYLVMRPAWEQTLLKSLRDHRSDSLAKMKIMTREVAKELENAPDQALTFQSLTSLDFLQASHLARSNAASLHFPKLTSLDEATKDVLLKYKGLITINGEAVSRPKLDGER